MQRASRRVKNHTSDSEKIAHFPRTGQPPFPSRIAFKR
jgi:hypothetical protein